MSSFCTRASRLWSFAWAWGALFTACSAAGCAGGQVAGASEEDATTSTGTGEGGSGGGFATTSGTGGDIGIGTGGGGCKKSNGGIELCDGADQDCDGLVDEDFDLSSPKTCGTCENSCYKKLLNCDPATIACAASADPGKEPGVCSCGGCSTDWFDLDGDDVCEYYCIETGSADDDCDNKDDDCDGQKDEDVDLCTDVANCGKCGGNCVVLHGTPICQSAGGSPCDASTAACAIETCDPGYFDLDGVYATGCEYACTETGGGVETCGDSVDNDCDGLIDDADDLSADPALGAECFGDPDGECATAAHAGTTVCLGNQVVCGGPNMLAEDDELETCNGKDDDCDGVIDDMPTDVGAPCGQANIAPCAFGVFKCQGGALACVGAVNPKTEVCNGQDDDCNGQIDDATLGAGASCGQSDVGACALGTMQCQGGVLQCVGAVDPKPETCNGADDDCDGNVDDTPSDVGATCGQSNTLPCKLGKVQCQNGAPACVGAVSPKEETCNGLDDDCDGQIDDGTIDSGQSCGQSGSYPCQLGSIVCQAGSLKCLGAVDPEPETCNLADDDCDGQIDDAPSGTGATCGTSDVGACSLGTVSCQAGALTCAGEVGPSIETCNGIDDDCDGTIDESPIGVGGACGQSGVAPCKLGTLQCQNGALACVGAVDPEAEVCNSLDDDCDGAVDDSPTDAGSACGTSNTFPCSFGSKQCQNGALVCVGDVGPKAEVCNGQDDDCDGTIDKTGGASPPDATGACNVPTPPPPGASSPCKAGTKACVGGAIVCQGSTGPTGVNDGCNVDANCDGALTSQPNTQSDVNNCGACGNDCYAGAVHSLWSCTSGACQFLGCEKGYYDLNGDNQCEYACVYVQPTEACNGIDDNCNGTTDEGVVGPSPSQVCGVSPSATTPGCTTQVSVTCQAGTWKCTFPAGVCSPTCAAATEVCDTLDNDCDGALNENVPNYGKTCASDDGKAPPGDGACKTTGTYVCNGTAATQCSATKADCSTLAGGCTELCDGVDNDCDGVIDEPFNKKGPNASYFVKPLATKVGATKWIHTYEASRPSATDQSAGNGNGYWCSGMSCNAVPTAPSGVTLDKTAACSVPGKIPWFNVSPVEVEQTCQAMGGTVCAAADWQTACKTTNSTACTWGYGPKGLSCTSTYTATKYCNLGPSFDFSAGTSGDQDGLLVGGSTALKNCWADWIGSSGNTAATEKLYDITGNLREITKDVAAAAYPLMGGAFNTADADGATCTFDFYAVDSAFKLYDVGFRCCFSADPAL